jgi:hypothetical protein
MDVMPDNAAWIVVAVSHGSTNGGGKFAFGGVPGKYSASGTTAISASRISCFAVLAMSATVATLSTIVPTSSVCTGAVSGNAIPWGAAPSGPVRLYST